MFPKIFNKRITWNDGERLQDVDLLVYEFRRIKDALKTSGTIQQLYIERVSYHGAHMLWDAEGVGAGCM